ncbi:MAG: hypothetical protein AAGJ52_09675, partial [Pseudomonadota bacterium]
IYWYTYDDQGNQRWIQGVGQLGGGADGQPVRITFDDLYETRGPRFGPDFDPDALEILPVGTGQLSFSNCDEGQFSYRVLGQSAVVPVIRLSQTMGSTCRPLHGVSGEPTQAYAGESGSWFDTETAGQGFSLHWLTRNEALVTWYTYDDQGESYWMVGNGVRLGKDIIFENLNATRGGRFGAAFDPDEVELIDWGRLELTLGCDGGEARYDSLLPEFGSGEMELTRLTAISGLDCAWARPAIGDLYQVSARSIPLGPTGPDVESVANGIGDDGSVLITDRNQSEVWLWRPDEALPSALNYPAAPARADLSADGQTIVALDELSPLVRFWNPADGWDESLALVPPPGPVDRVSHSATALYGFMRFPNDAQMGWVWTPMEGFRDFVTPELPEFSGEFFEVRAISDDGERLLASASFDEPPPSQAFQDFPILVEDDQARFFVDDVGQVIGGEGFGCDADCRTVAGLAEDFWIQPDGFPHQYLDIIVPSISTDGEFQALSGDGTILVGQFRIEPVDKDDPAEPFLWSQDLGVVLIRDLLDSLDINLFFNTAFRVRDISTDGLRMILEFDVPQPGPDPVLRTALILELTPRSLLESG